MQTRDTIRHQRDLQGIFQELAALLSRQDVVTGLVGRQDTPRRELVQNLLQRQQSAELQRKLQQLHPADIAFALENLPPERRALLWSQVPEKERGAILLELADPVRESLIGVMGHEEILSMAASLDPSAVAALVPMLPREAALDVLNALDRDNRKEVQSALLFPRDSVGSLMEFDMVTVREDMSMEEVLQSLRRNPSLPENFNQIFVVNQDGGLSGVLAVRDLMRSDPAALVRDRHDREAVAFHTDDSAREALGAFERYDLISAPVMNSHGQLVGVVKIDRIVDFKDEMAQKERLSQVGLSGDEDLFAPVVMSARNRWFWLGLNLTTAFVASRVIGMFESTIHQFVALAALMPIVASIGGNTGNQTVALMIRGIALQQITPDNLRRFLSKELQIGVINGFIWGCGMGLVTLLLYGEMRLALVMLAAMVGNFCVAALAGVSVPAALHYLGRDPVMGSSVLLTALTDSMGFLLFLGIATLVLI
ncbi:MAG: magnesium transporter [Gammaproteobacteria bacterium RIFCSPLOWO2_02_FULL_61_13]|nr:MAG: magnesium transporter [Gammaproteobacteria bacterium RIFCSPLOWO2_02_FULL_61_13]